MGRIKPVSISLRPLFLDSGIFVQWHRRKQGCHVQYVLLVIKQKEVLRYVGYNC